MADLAGHIVTGVVPQFLGFLGGIGLGLVLIWRLGLLGSTEGKDSLSNEVRREGADLVIQHADNVARSEHPASIARA